MLLPAEALRIESKSKKLDRGTPAYEGPAFLGVRHTLTEPGNIGFGGFIVRRGWNMPRKFKAIKVFQANLPRGSPPIYAG